MKKMKKSVDKERNGEYITQADSRGSGTRAKVEEKNLRFSKKVLDKVRRLRYNKQAVTRKGNSGCTLKIEQCKKKAYAK